jgi:hypothetical protein
LLNVSNVFIVAHNTNDVAVRLFALDRAIRYDVLAIDLRYGQNISMLFLSFCFCFSPLQIISLYPINNKIKTSLHLTYRSEKAEYKPRISFAPRCAITFQCGKTLCHVGKCEQIGSFSSMMRNEVSRIPDTIENHSGLQMFTVQGADGKTSYHYRKIILRGPTLRNRQQRGDDSDLDDEEEEDEDALMKKYIDKRTGLLNLDWIIPYVPQQSEVIESAWI